jgi:NADH-quinone oxidoreductase subunit J
MGFVFPLIATITLLGAVGAMAFRKSIHAVLSLVVALLGVAITFLGLGAEFIAMVQVLVYVGAVAILVVFVMQLTRSEGGGGEGVAVRPVALGVGAAALVCGGLIACVVTLPDFRAPWPEKPDVSLSRLGEALTREYVVALEGIGLLLTVAIIGAVLIALKRPNDKEASTD